MKLILSAVLAVCVASAASAQVCPNGVCPRAKMPLPMAGPGHVSVVAKASQALHGHKPIRSFLANRPRLRGRGCGF